MAELVVPAIDEQPPVGQVADRGLPLVAVVEAAPFDDAPAGEAEEARLQVGEHLHQVGAQAVRPILPGVLRAERHHVEIDHARRRGDQLQRRMGLGRRRSQRRGDRFHSAVNPASFAARRAAVPGRRPAAPKLPGPPALRSHTRGEHVLVAGSTPMPRKPQLTTPNPRPTSGFSSAGSSGCSSFSAPSERGPARRGRRNSAPAHQRLRELERAVFHQLGIQPAIAAEVDVLEKDAEQPRPDGRAGPAEIERHLRRVRHRGPAPPRLPPRPMRWRQGRCAARVF